MPNFRYGTNAHVYEALSRKYGLIFVYSTAELAIYDWVLEN